MDHDNQARPRKGANISLLRKIKSEDLFDKGSEVLIEHNEDEYHLRITSNGKLILTK